MLPLRITTISLEAFQEILSRYDASVPSKLQTLDRARYEEIPARVSPPTNNTKPQISRPALSKVDLLTLVEWKLKHGTFRPKLLSLVDSNSEATIESAMNEVSASRPHRANADTLKEMNGIKILTALKGIGPATASLVLSVYSPEAAPFFSDELFRWCMWDEPGSPGGWKRKIKYNEKEYRQLEQSMAALRSRLDVRAVDAEKVAWVLGKEQANIGEGIVDEEVEAEVKTDRTSGIEVGEDSGPKGPVESEKKPQARPGSKKRKADDLFEQMKPADGVRRSTRRRIAT